MATNDEKNIEACHKESQVEEIKPQLDYAGSHAKIDPAEIRLVRKLDIWILPILWLMYWLNFLDRNAITVARLDGLEKELKLTGNQYQTCISILFVGYVLGQIPASKNCHDGGRQRKADVSRYVDHQTSTFNLYVRLDGSLGHCQHVDRRYT